MSKKKMKPETNAEYQAKGNTKLNQIRKFDEILVSAYASKMTFACQDCNHMLSRDCDRCSRRLGLNLNELNYYGLDLALHLSDMWQEAAMEWLESTNILNNPRPRYLQRAYSGQVPVEGRIKELEDEIEQLKL